MALRAPGARAWAIFGGARSPILQRAHWPLALGRWAWLAAAGAAISHFVQANAYETGRKSYRRWVYGATWIRQNLAGGKGVEGLRGALGRLYLLASAASDPGAMRLDAAMQTNIDASGERAAAARALYRKAFAPLVSRSGVLSGNSRTIAAFLSLLAASPLWFFVFEMTALNAVLMLLIVARARRNGALIADLRSLV